MTVGCITTIFVTDKNVKYLCDNIILWQILIERFFGPTDYVLSILFVAYLLSFDGMCDSSFFRGKYSVVY